MEIFHAVTAFDNLCCTKYCNL